MVCDKRAWLHVGSVEGCKSIIAREEAIVFLMQGSVGRAKLGLGEKIVWPLAGIG
jgi:hypothetical protein